MASQNVNISVVCPFYNEALILEASVELMLKNLSRLKEPWELIIVNDGSTDDSPAIAQKLADKYPGQLKVLGYRFNRGRGYALRTGALAARGEILVTTEIDSSWGDDIVERLVAAMRESPVLDMVIASPNLDGGGYQNVPDQRVLLSRLGNKLLRLALSTEITMYTGMTRAYKRDKYIVLPLDEDEKEMHLEVARKAMAFGYVIGEIPAILTWKHNKLANPKQKGVWKSSAKIAKLVRTHLWFSLLAAPFRYLIAAGAGLLVISSIFVLMAFVNLFTREPSIFYLLTGLTMSVLSFLMFGLAVLSRQTIEAIHESWRLRRDLKMRDIQKQESIHDKLAA